MNLPSCEKCGAPTRNKYGNGRCFRCQGCGVEGCVRDRFADVWCQTHWHRWKNSGNPPEGPIADMPIRTLAAVNCRDCGIVLPPVNQDGRSGSRCKDCDRIRQREWRLSIQCSINNQDCSVSYASGLEGPTGPLCTKHWERYKQYGDALHVPGPAPRGEDAHNWLGDDIKYRAALVRVKVQRGEPEECEQCFKRDGYFVWTLKPSATEVRYDEDGSQSGVLYSLNVMDYESLCKSCWGCRVQGKRKKVDHHPRMRTKRVYVNTKQVCSEPGCERLANNERCYQHNGKVYVTSTNIRTVCAEEGCEKMANDERCWRHKRIQGVKVC